MPAPTCHSWLLNSQLLMSWPLIWNSSLHHKSKVEAQENVIHLSTSAVGCKRGKIFLKNTLPTVNLRVARLSWVAWTTGSAPAGRRFHTPPSWDVELWEQVTLLVSSRNTIIDTGLNKLHCKAGASCCLWHCEVYCKLLLLQACVRLSA